MAATTGVPKHFSGLASGILNTSQQVGGALGLAILSVVFVSTFKEDLANQIQPVAAQVHGYHDGLLVGVVLALIAVLVSSFLVKNHKIDAKESMMAG